MAIKVNGQLLQWARLNAGLSMTQLEAFGFDCYHIGDMEHTGCITKTDLYEDGQFIELTAEATQARLASLYGVKPELFQQNINPATQADKLWWLAWLESEVD